MSYMMSNMMSFWYSLLYSRLSQLKVAFAGSKAFFSKSAFLRLSSRQLRNDRPHKIPFTGKCHVQRSIPVSRKHR